MHDSSLKCNGRVCFHVEQWPWLFVLPLHVKIKISAGFSLYTNPGASYSNRPADIVSASYLFAAFCWETRGEVAVWSKHCHRYDSQVGVSFSKVQLTHKPFQSSSQVGWCVLTYSDGPTAKGGKIDLCTMCIYSNAN